MDVYKWATKLGPVVPGDLLLDCFELARDIRTLDMRASPYDVTSYDLEPIAIETAEGKASTCAASAASPSGRTRCDSGCSRPVTPLRTASVDQARLRASGHLPR